MSNTVILIPSRMSAERLPGKPLLKVNGLALISHVVKKAQETQIGDVIVATEDEEIVTEVKKNKGQAILTSKKPKTGTDRIWEALVQLDLKNIEYVINLQGDEPLIDINDIKNLDILSKKNNSDLSTLASNLEKKSFLVDQNIVKVQTNEKLEKNKLSKAINFLRNANNLKDNIYHHIGIYEFKVSTLKNYTSLNQTKNERKYKLEQLRAMENNIKVDVAYASSKSIGIDTKEDFMELKKIMEYNS